MDKNSLSYKTLKNVSYSFVSYGWGIIFAIFVTPIIVFKLGIDNYGVYIFINTVLVIFGLVDVGFSTAVSKYGAEYYGGKDQNRLKSLLYSANSIFLITGIIGLFLSAIVGILGQYFISSPAILVYNLPVIFFITGIMFLLSAINSVYVLTPIILQRFDISTKIGIMHTAFSSLSILVVVVLGFKLQAIFLSQLIILIIFTFIYRYYSQKILPIAQIKFTWDKLEIIKCYKFGLTAYISNISGQALSYFDKLIIPIFISPVSLSYYSLSSSVASKSTGLISSLTGILLPLTSTLKGENDKKNINKLYIRSFRLTTILSAAISFAIAFFAYKIMLYWLDEGIAVNTYIILIILAPTYFIISLYAPLKNFLLGLGEVKILATYSVSMTLLNIVLVLILLSKFGIMGAAIAYLISVLPTFLIFYYVEKKILKLEGRLNYYIKLYSKLVFTGIVFYFISVFLIKPLIVNFIMLIVLGPLSVIIYLLIYKILGFYEEEDWLSFKNFLFICVDKFRKRKLN